MTELTKLIIEKGNLQEAFEEYFSKVIDEISEVKMIDAVSKTVISDIKNGDFFWAAATALEVISIKSNGIVFTNDEDDLYNLKNIKPIINEN